MEDSFLSSLIDTTGNNFVFGKSESTQLNVFLNFGTENGSVNNPDALKYTQLYKGHELKPINTFPVLRKNILRSNYFAQDTYEIQISAV